MFRAVDPTDAVEVMSSFLDMHRRVVLKPACETSGHAATFIALDRGDIVVRQTDRHWREPRAAGLAGIANLIGPAPSILQKMIVSRVDDGRTFDIRTHAHKDGSGHWARVRSYVGLSDAGRLVSTARHGGLQGGVGKVLARQTEDGAALADRVRNLGLQACETLDRACGGELVDLEAVIVIDPEHRLWIAGVTPEPVTPFHEFERARQHVAYAVHVARRFRAGERHAGPGGASAKETGR